MKLRIEFLNHSTQESRLLASLRPGSLKNIIDHSVIPPRTLSVFYPSRSSTVQDTILYLSHPDRNGTTTIDLNNYNAIIAQLAAGYGYETPIMLSQLQGGNVPEPSEIEQGILLIKPELEADDIQTPEMN